MIRAVLLMTVLTACNIGNRQAEGDGVTRIVTDRIRAGLGGGEDATPPPTVAQVRAALTPEVRAALPAPTLLVQVEGTGGVSLPQRITVNGATETYLTEDDSTLAFRDGMLVGTRGIGFDLMAADVAEASAAIRAGRTTRITRTMSWLDGTGAIVRRGFTCGIQPVGGRITETCNAIGLAFENDYVIRGGNIVASRQWSGPVQGHIRIERVN
ncbi:YjbF family lipoprotein [Jannaschia sp. KMU-145]|uniref:YjbF family lipoprotein n=1 Tax=Jannaschia halovivens TaxID=3388667 RepID=UPI00396B0FC8